MYVDSLTSNHAQFWFRPKINFLGKHQKFGSGREYEEPEQPPIKMLFENIT